MFEFDDFGNIKEDIFPNNLGYEDIIKEYNAWRNETMFLSVGIELNEHYKNMLKMPPHRILPFCVEIMRQRPSWMNGIFESVCPLITYNGYISLEFAQRTNLSIWDNALCWLEPELLDKLCDELAMNPDLNKKPVTAWNLFPKKIAEKFNDAMIRAIYNVTTTNEKKTIQEVEQSRKEE